MRKRLTVLAALCLIGCVLLGGMVLAFSWEPRFYRVEGEQIMSPRGEPVILKGIHFNNGVYQMPDSADADAITLDHTAESYLEAAEMGLNHVRLALNYQLFEDDAAPYVYKEDGFEVIDRNLAWAKAAGVDIILQIKWPQGGCQMETDQMAPVEWGLGNGGKCLWIDIDESGNPLNTEHYRENQNRLVALWGEIAKRYADEPAIIGYNLFNEPVVPQKEHAEATVAQVQGLMQRIADSIRAGDENHILFVEQLVGWFDPEDPASTDKDLLTVADTQYLIDDDNVVYEFHFYEPYTFTHQGADWLPQFPEGVCYPQDIDREHVEEALKASAAFGEEHGVPLYVGEWGIHEAAVEYGAEAYVTDLCGLLEKYGLGSSYYSYRDEAFGLYVCGDGEEPGERNEELYRLLAARYGKSAEK